MIVKKATDNEGTSYADLVMLHPEIHYKAGQKAKEIFTIAVQKTFVENYRAPVIIGIQGETDTGKSFKVEETWDIPHNAVYQVPLGSKKKTQDELRWDNYNPKIHKVVWLREWKDTHLSLQYLNGLMDRKKFSVRMMGVANVEIRPPVILIETNQHFHSWYSDETDAERQAFLRRFTVISRWLKTRREVSEFYDNVFKLIPDIKNPPLPPPRPEGQAAARVRWLENNWFLMKNQLRSVDPAGLSRDLELF